MAFKSGFILAILVFSIEDFASSNTALQEGTFITNISTTRINIPTTTHTTTRLTTPTTTHTTTRLTTPTTTHTTRLTTPTTTRLTTPTTTHTTTRLTARLTTPTTTPTTTRLTIPTTTHTTTRLTTPTTTHTTTRLTTPNTTHTTTRLTTSTTTPNTTRLTTSTTTPNTTRLTTPTTTPTITHIINFTSIITQHENTTPKPIITLLLSNSTPPTSQHTVLSLVPTSESNFSTEIITTVDMHIEPSHRGQVETTTSAAEVTTSHGHHDITCTESRMEFSIPLSSPHTSETATLSDPNCPINVTRTHVRGGVDLNSCGTTVQFQNDSVIFRNAIIFSAPESSSLGSSGSNSSVSQYQDIIPIQCVYNRLATVHLSYMPVVRRVLFTESGVGQFSFNIQQFWDASFTNMVSDGAYPLRMELDADVFIQLSVGSEGQPVAGHKEIGMEVQQCLVSPSSSVIEAQLHYYPLIQDGCPASSDVHIIPNTNASDSTVMRFRFRAVNFFDPSSSSSSSLVFVHCRMGLCLTGSCKPSAWSCLTPPARRVRRDVDQSKRAAHQLSTGPFLIMADEASTSSSSTTATVMAVVSTSVATVAIVIAAIALIALRRRRTTERN